MKYLIIASLFMLSCKNTGLQSDESTSQSGFLFIDISSIYHNGGEVTILGKDDKRLVHIRNTKITLGGSEYDVIEEEHLYKDSINAEVFYPEYGLFILNCYGKSHGYYSVKVNGIEGLIKVTSNKVKFKNFEQYVLDTYPVPEESNPLKANPDDNSDIVDGYLEHTYTPVEIKGDWIRVKDDKDCYSGENPSDMDIEGWIKWRENDSFILKVAHSC